MKRFLPVVGILVTVPVVLALILVLSAKKAEKGKWKPLPSGGEIAFHGVTHGLEHVMYHTHISLSERVKFAVRTKSWRALVFGNITRRTKFHAGNSPRLVVWFAIRGRSGRPSQAESELHLPDGRIYYNDRSGNPGNGEFWQHTFPEIPFTAEKMRVVVLSDGSRFEWVISNPTYNPNWAAETPSLVSEAD